MLRRSRCGLIFLKKNICLIDTDETVTAYKNWLQIFAVGPERLKYVFSWILVIFYYVVVVVFTLKIVLTSIQYPSLS